MEWEKIEYNILIMPIPRVIAPPLRVVLHSEYTVSTCPPVSRSFASVRVYYRLDCFSVFASVFLSLFFPHWIGYF